MDNRGVLSIGPSEIGIPVRFSRRHYRRRANSAAWGWGNQGHEIIATIAADNLSLSAREQVARILGTASDAESLEKAMAAASVRPDTEFREEDRSTAPWHYIDICLQDRRTD